MYETIAALSTAPVTAPVGIIRASGADVLDIADSLFETPGGLTSLPSHKLRYGKLLDETGGLIDMAMAVVMRAPNSFTGENMVEFHCHGSMAVLQACLNALYARGARPARAGEFTKRAFLHGRMDLTQVEATIDLIDSGTALAARNAAAQVDGALTSVLSSVYDDITGMCAHFHAAVDYPDEDVFPLSLSHLRERLNYYEKKLRRLYDTYERGRVLRDGVKCAIIGRPNVGKSSLLNALVGYDRVIVTDTPGTTRDTVEETLSFGGVLLRISDTAGLRDSDDTVEKLGIERTKAAAAGAALLFIVLDGSQPLTEDDRKALDYARGTKTIVVVNKSDLPGALDINELEAAFLHVCSVSSTLGEGLEQLSSLVRRCCDNSTPCRGAHCASADADAPHDTTLLTNHRQADAVRRAVVSLREADAALGKGYTPDVVLGELELALDALGEILGRRISEDILKNIFSRFCVGK